MATGASITSEVEYRYAYRALTRESEAPHVLRMMMRIFEAYRAARKQGWSRPWNKNGVCTFQAFRLDAGRDRDLIGLGSRVLADLQPSMPEGAATFVRELLADDRLMGFVFVHENEDEEGRFEGATLSLGRKVQGNARYRDRLDLVIESRIAPLPSGIDRFRVFVDPFRGPGGALWSTSYCDSMPEGVEALLEGLVDVSWNWAGDPARVWSHWSTKYIEYFGPRRWAMPASRFAHDGACAVAGSDSAPRDVA